jgi:hypothetical protein
MTNSMWVGVRPFIPRLPSRILNWPNRTSKKRVSGLRRADGIKTDAGG